MATIDLTGEVTYDQYVTALNALLLQFEVWRIQQGWCHALYRYVAQLSDTFQWNTSEKRMELAIIPSDRTGAEMTQDLRNIRGRMLAFTDTQIGREAAFTVARANTFLTGAGLPGYPTVTGRVTYRVYVGTFNVESDQTADQVRDQIAGYIRDTLHSTTDPFIELDTFRQRVTRVSAEDMVPLLPWPRYL